MDVVVAAFEAVWPPGPWIPILVRPLLLGDIVSKNTSARFRENTKLRVLEVRFSRTVLRVIMRFVFWQSLLVVGHAGVEGALTQLNRVHFLVNIEFLDSVLMYTFFLKLVLSSNWWAPWKHIFC